MSECERTVPLQMRLRLFMVWVLRDMGMDPLGTLNQHLLWIFLRFPEHFHICKSGVLYFPKILVSESLSLLYNI